jgi:prevent-host-death family protein
MNWPIQDAKARFSELLKECMNQGPQVITKHGMQTAVLVPIDQWLAITQSNQMDIKNILLSPQAKTSNLAVPKRGLLKHRKPPSL